MANTTDVILAAGPTVVALAAIGSAVWQQQRGFTHSRALADLDAARAVLDDAAVALQDAAIAVAVRMGELGPNARVAYDEALGRVGVIRERVALRFGTEHRTYAPLAAAFVAMSDIDSQLPESSLHERPSRLILDAPEGPASSWRPRWEQARNAWTEFDAARLAFLAAALETAGVRL